MSRLATHQDKPARTQRSAIPLNWKGLGAVVLAEAGVRSCDRGGRVTPAGRYVRVPARYPDGTEHRAQIYGADGRPCGWTPGNSLLPIGLDRLPDGFGAALGSLFLFEGVSDMLSFREWCAEWEGRRADTLALPGSSTWRNEWGATVKTFGVVYVCADADQAGRRMADAILADVPGARRVVLPEGEDVRALIQSGRGDELEAAIGRADLDALLWEAFHQPTIMMARAQLRAALRHGYRPAELRYAA